MAQYVFSKSNPILGRGNYHAKHTMDGKQQKFKLVEGMMIDSSLPQQPSILATRGDKHDKDRFQTTARDIGQICTEIENKFAPANATKVLRFYAFFEENVDESSSELFRLRRTMILFYLRDDTIEIIENRTANSGLPQGTFLKRGKLMKPNNAGHYRFDDLFIGMQFPIFGRTFKIYSCDEFTRNYYAENAFDLAPPIDIPKDEYTMTRDQISKLCGGDPGHFYGKKNSALKTFMEATLGNHGLNGAKKAKFLANSRKVLHFECEYDDRQKLYGDLTPYSLNYFLEDDTIEIKEIERPNSGRDPFPLLLSRSHLLKQWESAITDEQDRGVEEPTPPEAYYNESDLFVGAVINVYSRAIKLVDADDYTRKYYQEAWNLELKPPIYTPPPKNDKKKPPPPPYIGYGTEEDSMGSVTHLVPKVPKKDFIKMTTNDRKLLRFSAKMVSNRREQAARQFIMTFYLADDTISIYEPEQRNSGIVSGKFLERGPHKNPSGVRYTLNDFKIGNELAFNAYKFHIIDADDYTKHYLNIPA
ncbi:RIB72 protein [Thraustotheca clavata]|uniref:RIB72 protein n=1 Tax=Thraustotheca clavata TaxID=74557 RepID=A0A1V9ZZF0_9STRA|nr:RIB72 protein [Thraustotheca clavata]